MSLDQRGGSLDGPQDEYTRRDPKAYLRTVGLRGLRRVFGQHKRGDGLPAGARQGERAYVPRPLPTGERVPRRAVELFGKDGRGTAAPTSATRGSAAVR